MKRADHHLVQQVLDGQVNREAFDGFQQRLRNEPDLEKLYGDYALLQHTLYEEFEDSDPPEQPVTSGIGRRSLAAVMVLILLAAVAWCLQPHMISGSKDDAAVATFSLDAAWQIDGASRNLGGATGLAKGTTLHLHQGRAAIALKPSVSLIIEGPAGLTVLAPDSVKLAKGKGYFRCGGNGSQLTVKTPKMTALDLNAEFAILSNPETDDEIHVAAGRVKVIANASGEESILDTGEAARIPASGPVNGFPGDVSSFATALGRFEPMIAGPFKPEEWRVAYGNPSISAERIEGMNYAVFAKLPQPETAEAGPIMLATIELAESTDGNFHTDGWAGMSFFSNGQEVAFFGDSFGSQASWSLDVKQRIPVIYPLEPVQGVRKVTLRHDFRNGEVSLHEGGMPLEIPFCVGKVPVGTRFDEIRIGASAGAALAVKSLQIRMGGD